MSKFFSRRPKAKGPLPSPGYLLEWAGFLTLLFVIVNVAGMREFTSVLNGTNGSTTLNWQTAAFLGAAYVFVYLAFVLGAPILVLAALMLKLWQRLIAKGITDDESRPQAEMD
jgi:hypothetical protein